MPRHKRVIIKCQTSDGSADRQVRARIERFIEPVTLLALRDGPAHGYELADTIEAMAPTVNADYGNLYRLLRSLEGAGAVASEWRDDLPGRPRRVYQLTDSGSDLLRQWAASLEETRGSVTAFLTAYQEGGR